MGTARQSRGVFWECLAEVFGYINLIVLLLYIFFQRYPFITQVCLSNPKIMEQLPLFSDFHDQKCQFGCDLRYVFNTFKTIIKIKSILKQQMNLQTHTEHTDSNCIQITKKNSTRPNSFVKPLLSSHHSSHNCQVSYSDRLIQSDNQLNKTQKTRDQLAIKGETLQIDYLSEESLVGVLGRIDKIRAIKEKTRICLKMVILKQGLAHNKKLSALFQICARQYQKCLQDEML